MKKIKTLIICVIILIILTILIFVSIIIYNKKESTSEEKKLEFEKQIDYEADTQRKKEDNKNRYYAVLNIVNKFLTYVLDKNSEAIFNTLNPEYIEKYNITQTNVYDKINCFDFSNLDEYQIDNINVQIKIKDMYRIEKSVNIRNYFIYGNIVNSVNNVEIPYNIIVNMDSKNNTFYILPNDYVKDNRYDEINNIEIYKADFDEISKNSYNVFQFINIEDSQVINDYLNNYKDLIAKDKEKSFDFIADDYKKIKFVSYEQYEEYLSENIKNLLVINFEKYKVNKKEYGKEYICIDSNGNYYIIEETAIMDYKIYLDDYTVDSEEFIEKYNQETQLNKVKYNTEKFVKALNRKDYNYIYEKLDDTFKNNYFLTIEDFKKYMQTRYNNYYTIEYFETREESGTYIQPINLVEKSGNKEEQEIIMQLKSGTDFVMSFNIT